MNWRRKRDSNPRTSYPVNGFQDRRLQPLGHSSDSYRTVLQWMAASPAMALLRCQKIQFGLKLLQLIYQLLML